MRIVKNKLISVSQIGTIIAQIRKNEWYASQNIFCLDPKENEELLSMMVLSAINKSLRGRFSGGYSNYPTLKTLRSLTIQLPIKRDREIDYEFMKKFIAELEAYLEVTGLINYALTKEEEQALKQYNNLKFNEFYINDIFDIFSTRKRFDANKVNIIKNGKYPYIVRTSTNNGQKGFINENPEFLNEGKTISFGQDTATAFYQKQPYFTGDKIKVLKLKFGKLEEKDAMYFLTAISKSFSNFSWGSSSYSVETIRNQTIELPITKKGIDYSYMETFISAIQKLVIKDVVKYVNREIEATKNIIFNKK